jgi:hypothetical protein
MNLSGAVALCFIAAVYLSFASTYPISSTQDYGVRMKSGSMF